MLGLIIEDTLNQQPEGIWSSGPVGNFNRNRYSTTRTPPLWERIKAEAEQAGASWGPIRAGIFGGSTDRFDAAEEGTASTFSGFWECVVGEASRKWLSQGTPACPFRTRGRGLQVARC